MNNILCIVIFFSLAFNLNAASFSNCAPVNFYRIMLLNVALINKLDESVFVGRHGCKQKNFYIKKYGKLTGNQKALKTKKYCLIQPKLKNSVKVEKNKEKIIVNNNFLKQKNKPIKNKRNKLNKQHLYDKKIGWLADLDCDDNTIVFNEEKKTDLEDMDEKIDVLIKRWLLEDQLCEEQLFEEPDNRIGLFCFIDELCEEQESFLIEKYISEKELRKEQEDALIKSCVLDGLFYKKEERAWVRQCKQLEKWRKEDIEI